MSRARGAPGARPLMAPPPSRRRPVAPGGTLGMTGIRASLTCSSACSRAGSANTSWPPRAFPSPRSGPASA